MGAIRDLDPLPVALMNDPLEFILADHYRQRTVCTCLRQFADGQATSASALLQIADFLQTDLPVHHRDEDEDLFPTLLRRALPEDNLVAVIGRLQSDHVEASARAGLITRILQRARHAAEILLTEAERALFHAFALGEHRHLAIENGVVLAIARVRFTRADFAKITAHMRARRGLPAEG